MQYIIVTALPEESQGLEKFAPVIHTGIGKVNACIKLYDAILKYKPQLVINYGTAGGLSNFVGLHKVDYFVQTDMDVRGLDVPRGITPFSNESLPKISLQSKIVLGTSDSFITNAKKQLEGLNVKIDMVDMEAYALNKVCQHHNVKFEAYKYISDSANKSAGGDWEKSVSKGTHIFAEVLEKRFLSKI